MDQLILLTLSNHSYYELKCRLQKLKLKKQTNLNTVLMGFQFCLGHAALLHIQIFYRKTANMLKL